MKKTLLIIVLSLTFVGCAGPRQVYQGEIKPVEEVAVIRAGREGTMENRFMSVDGKDMQDGKSVSSDVKVLPGKHTLGVINNYTPGLAEPTLNTVGFLHFIAEAGHVYDLESVGEDGEAYFWLEDAETGEVVSEEKPPKKYLQRQ